MILQNKRNNCFLFPREILKDLEKKNNRLVDTNEIRRYLHGLSKTEISYVVFVKEPCSPLDKRKRFLNRL